MRIPLGRSVLRQGCAEPALGPIPALLSAAPPAWPWERFLRDSREGNAQTQLLLGWARLWCAHGRHLRVSHSLCGTWPCPPCRARAPPWVPLAIQAFCRTLVPPQHLSLSSKLPSTSPTSLNPLGQPHGGFSTELPLSCLFLLLIGIALHKTQSVALCGTGCASSRDSSAPWLPDVTQGPGAEWQDISWSALDGDKARAGRGCAAGAPARLRVCGSSWPSSGSINQGKQEKSSTSGL